jgi:hypothetical protein
LAKRVSRGKVGTESPPSMVEICGCVMPARRASSVWDRPTMRRSG